MSDRNCAGLAVDFDLKEDKHAFSVVSGTYDESPADDAGKYKADRSDH